jgi:hypothetical protein
MFNKKRQQPHQGELDMPTLTLNPGGPTPNPLDVSVNDRSVTIQNNLNVAVTLTLTPAGFLNPSTGNQLEVSTTGWTGTAGATGDYEYADPTSREKGTRSGRIVVG